MTILIGGLCIALVVVGMSWVYTQDQLNRTRKTLAVYTKIEPLFPIGIVIMNSSLQVLHINHMLKAWAKTCQTPLAEFIQLPILTDAIQRGQSSLRLTIEQQLVNIQVVPFSTTGEPLHCIFFNPAVAHSATTANDDFTSYNQALRTTALGLAHELKNPITSIKLLLQMNSTHPVMKDPAQFKGILSFEVERLDKIIGDFLHFSDIGPMNFEPTNINHVIERVEQIINADHSDKSFKLKNSFFPVPAIPIDKTKLTQALLNIILNAIDALPEFDGEIHIQTKKMPPYVQLTISDNGHGISPMNKPKIYLPFFTTKKDGLGLGLSVAEKIIHEHSGQLTCHSQVGQSTTFTILLPIKHAILSPSTLTLPKQEVLNTIE